MTCPQSASASGLSSQGGYRSRKLSSLLFHCQAHQPSLTKKVSRAPLNNERVVLTTDDRLVRIGLQRWFTRICEDPVMMRHDELREFIESDFNVRQGYSIPLLLPTHKGGLGEGEGES